MYEYARSLGVFPAADPLAGLETKISLAKTAPGQWVNLVSCSGGL
jgi:hypothetical protein